MHILVGYKRRAAYTLLGAFVTMMAIGSAAMVTQQPFIFPSLGPTALMIFAHPLRRESAPRHVLIGHAIGAGSGYAALAITGLIGVPFSSTVSTHRVFAAALALGITAALMILARAEHAPAGATTLIVALGILPQLRDFVALMLAVAALTLFGLAINRCFRIPYPYWYPLEPYRVLADIRRRPVGTESGRS
jgi:CBS-domain-containing membrane protein